MATDTIGNYKLISRLGSGGTGTVFKAYQENLKRVVALKVLHPGYARNSSLLKRFKREILTTASLNHPNLVKVFDAGQEGDRYYFSMEFIDGFALRDKVRGGKSVPIKEALALLTQLVEAIRYFHSKGMVHRDIKPENIMVCADGTVKLMDFGIVKVHDCTVITQEGSTLGTPRYMSPEMVTGDPQDHRSDLFQIGVVLYELVTGRCPFDGPTISDIACRITDTEPQAPSAVGTGIAPALDRIILKCLAKSPDQRYQSADELADDLKASTREIEQGGRPPARQAQRRLSTFQPALTPQQIDPSPTAPMAEAPADWWTRSYSTISTSLKEPAVTKGLILTPIAFLIGLGAVFWCTPGPKQGVVSALVVEEGLSGLQAHWETAKPCLTEIELIESNGSSRRRRNNAEASATRHTILISDLVKGSSYQVRIVNPDGGRSEPVSVKIPTTTSLLAGGPTATHRNDGSVEVVVKTNVPTTCRVRYQRGTASIDRTLGEGYAREHRLLLEKLGPDEEIRDLKISVDGVDRQETVTLCIMGGTRLGREFQSMIRGIPEGDWDSLALRLMKTVNAAVKTAKAAGTSPPVGKDMEAAQQILQVWLKQRNLDQLLASLRLLGTWVFRPSGPGLEVACQTYKALQRLEDIDFLGVALGVGPLLDIPPIYTSFVSAEEVTQLGQGVVVLDNTGGVMHYLCTRYRKEYPNDVLQDGKHFTIGALVGSSFKTVSSKFIASSTVELNVGADELAANDRFRLVFQVANMRADVFFEVSINGQADLRVRNNPKQIREFDYKAILVASEDVLAASNYVSVAIPTKLLRPGKNQIRIGADTITGLNPVPGATLVKVLYRPEPSS